MTYIWDWRTQNKIRADRKKDSIYAELLLQIDPNVELLEKKPRSDVGRKNGPSTDGGMSAQCSAGKDSLGEISIGKCSVAGNTHGIAYRLGHETLTVSEYDELVRQYSKDVADRVIHRILEKPYHNCLNWKTIAAWCEERTTSAETASNKSIGTSVHVAQLSRLASERFGG